MKEKRLNISDLNTGWDLGTGPKPNTIANLNNVQLKIALETLYQRDTDLQQIEVNDMREKIMDDARNHFISQATSGLTQTNRFGRPSMMAPDSYNQAMTRAETNYNAWFDNWKSRGSPIDEHIGIHGSITQTLTYPNQPGIGGGGGGQVPYNQSPPPASNSQYQGNSGIGGGGGQVSYNQVHPSISSSQYYPSNTGIGGGGGGQSLGFPIQHNNQQPASSSSSSLNNSSMNDDDIISDNNVFGQARIGGGSSSKNYTKTKKRYKRHRNTRRKTRHHNKKSKYNRKYKKRRITRRRKN